MSSIPSTTDRVSVPTDEGLLVGVAWVGYFLVLLAVPLVLPAVLSAAVGMDFLDALKLALEGAAVGYVVGLVVLLRP